jgi:asparaginyl-tRNA synthetase
VRRSLIKDILRQGSLGHEVTVCGWVRSKRESKGFAFVVLNDGSSQENLQLIVPGESSAAGEARQCATGAAVAARGVVRESPAKGQRIELEVSQITVLGEADPEQYPLQKKGHSLEFLREIGHLRPRTNTLGAVFRLRNILAAAVHEFFQGQGFLWVHTPIITASDCEGAGQLFSVTSLDPEHLPLKNDGTVDFSQDLFGRRSFLSVSGQLEAEFLAMALGNVYTFGPTFRAENSNTARHLAEFWMIEPEMAFADLEDDMLLAEEFFRFLCRRAVEGGSEELAFLEKQYGRTSREELLRLTDTPFVRITYTDAVGVLKKSREAFQFPVEWGSDLQSEHERYLTDEVFKGPVIVSDYPKEIKAFYMRTNPDGKTVAAMDVLVPKVGEIIGGSQREERLDVLEARMREMKISPESLQWYLDLRRFGTAPHAGFGLGFERLVLYVTGMANIRDVIPCPRAPGSIGI